MIKSLHLNEQKISCFVRALTYYREVLTVGKAVYLQNEKSYACLFWIKILKESELKITIGFSAHDPKSFLILCYLLT
jgi:hypothetical protein